MKLIHTLILNRGDLVETNANLKIGDIQYTKFKHEQIGILLHEELALFVDDNGAIKVLKDRSGLLDPKKQ